MSRGTAGSGKQGIDLHPDKFLFLSEGPVGIIWLMTRIAERLARYRLLAPSLFALACLPAAGAEPDYFCDLTRVPDQVSAVTETEIVNLALTSPKASARAMWQAGVVSVLTAVRAGGIDVAASAPGIALKRLQIHWQGKPGRRLEIPRRRLGARLWRPGMGTAG
jgi:hypothetical protein